MRVKLYKVRLAFPQLFEPSVFTSSDGTTSPPRYSAKFIMPKDHKNVRDVKSAMQNLAKQKWGQKAAAVYKQLQAQDRLALHDGDTKADEGFEGNVFVGASAKPDRGERPVVVGRDNRILKPEDGIPYAGCYVNASIELWAQDNSWGKRINATLCTVQFVEDGERFGGGGAPGSPDEFEPLDEAETEGDFADDAEDTGSDETDPFDDDIPF